MTTPSGSIDVEGLVKPLEWIDHTQGPGCPIRRIAKTTTCVVWIFQAGEADHWYLSYNSGLNGWFLVKGDEAAARAAAQSDYAARILSAAPALIDRIEALEASLKWFVDRAAPIQSKFALYGPKDTADAMVDAFRLARTTLSGDTK